MSNQLITNIVNTILKNIYNKIGLFNKKYLYPIVNRIKTEDDVYVDKTQYMLIKSIYSSVEYIIGNSKQHMDKEEFNKFNVLENSFDAINDYFMDHPEYIVDETDTDTKQLEEFDYSMRLIKEFFIKYLLKPNTIYQHFTDDRINDYFKSEKPLVRFYNRCSLYDGGCIFSTSRFSGKRWFWFMNPFNDLWYIANDIDFKNVIKTKHKPSESRGIVYIKDEEYNRTFIFHDDFDPSDYENWVNGNVVFYDNFLYYKDNDSNKYYISSSDNIRFHRCVLESTKEPINVNSIGDEFYVNGIAYITITDYRANHYASTAETPGLFRRIPYIPKSYNYDKMTVFYNNYDKKPMNNNQPNNNKSTRVNKFAPYIPN